MTDIRDQYGFGGLDVYPKTLAAGHDILEDHARSRKLYAKKKKTKTPFDKNKNREDRTVNDTNT